MKRITNLVLLSFSLLKKYEGVKVILLILFFIHCLFRLNNSSIICIPTLSKTMIFNKLFNL
ncbi:hypothetical protein Lalb_Chr11g0071201 [Lupinus albus]|uniref:Uncharacterized protein n=1 Tax=Lupinus albus TaxID=3870 RepID=A0A6A4PRZ9_LUPAL|nr:hypothetical protein Lalb_Chr11g0071201 [Lupinus albus]